MSCLQVTAFRPSLSVSNQYKRVHGSASRCIAPVTLKPKLGSSKKCTELMKHYMRRGIGASRYQQCTPVCLFGGKGESKNGNEGSPWKSMEKAMSSFKKEPSLEEVLKQQMENQDYYDGGGAGDPPSGSGGGGGGGGGMEDEGFAELWDEILQVILASLAFIAMYVNMVAGDRVKMFFASVIAILSGKKGPRLRAIMYKFAQFYQGFRTRVPYDPYWLEKEIICTPTYWDSPEKYRRMLGLSRPQAKHAYSDGDSDSDTNIDTDDNMYNDDSGVDADDD